MYDSSTKDLPAPGQYTVPTSLSKEARSFTRSSFARQMNKDHQVGPLCGQPTQFI
jgi:hypothetical protein